MDSSQFNDLINKVPKDSKWATEATLSKLLDAYEKAEGIRNDDSKSRKDGIELSKDENKVKKYLIYGYDDLRKNLGFVTNSFYKSNIELEDFGKIIRRTKIDLLSISGIIKFSLLSMLAVTTMSFKNLMDMTFESLDMRRKGIQLGEGIDTLVDVVKETNIPLSVLSDTLKGNTQLLSAFSNSTRNGINVFEDLHVSGRNYILTNKELMLNQKELLNASIDYMSILVSTGKVSEIDRLREQKHNEEYLNSIQRLGQVVGLSAEAISRLKEEQHKSINFEAMRRRVEIQMSKDAAESFNNFYTLFRGAGLSDDILHPIATFVAGIFDDPEYAKLMQQGLSQGTIMALTNIQGAIRKGTSLDGLKPYIEQLQTALSLNRNDQTILTRFTSGTDNYFNIIENISRTIEKINFDAKTKEWENELTKLGHAWDTLRISLMPISTTMAKTLTIVLEKLKTMFDENFMEKLEKMGDGLGRIITFFGETLMEWVNDRVDRFISLMNKSGNDDEKLVESTFGLIWESIISFFSVLWVRLEPMVSSLIESIIEEIKDNVIPFRRTIRERVQLINTSVDVFRQMFKKDDKKDKEDLEINKIFKRIKNQQSSMVGIKPKSDEELRSQAKEIYYSSRKGTLENNKVDMGGLVKKPFIGDSLKPMSRVDVNIKPKEPSRENISLLSLNSEQQTNKELNEQNQKNQKELESINSTLNSIDHNIKLLGVLSKRGNETLSRTANEMSNINSRIDY